MSQTLRPDDTPRPAGHLKSASPLKSQPQTSSKSAGRQVSADAIEPLTEADPERLPPGLVHLSVPLAIVVARLALAGVEPVLTLEDWPVVLACSRREVERLKSAGKLPPPDFHLGKMPRWAATTVRAYLNQLAKGRGAR